MVPSHLPGCQARCAPGHPAEQVSRYGTCLQCLPLRQVECIRLARLEEEDPVSALFDAGSEAGEDVPAQERGDALQGLLQRSRSWRKDSQSNTVGMLT